MMIPTSFRLDDIVFSSSFILFNQALTQSTAIKIFQAFDTDIDIIELRVHLYLFNI